MKSALDLQLAPHLGCISELLRWHAAEMRARRAVVLVMGKLIAEERAPHRGGFGKPLREAYSSVRQAVVVRVGRLSAEERRPHLWCTFELLRDADARVRQAAVLVIGRRAHRSWWALVSCCGALRNPELGRWRGANLHVDAQPIVSIIDIP